MSKLNESGRFAATVRAPQWGQSKEKNTPFLRLDFETEKGSITGWLYFSERAREGTVQRLREVFRIGNDAKKWAQEIDGKECNIVTAFEEDNSGKERLVVKFVNPAGGGVKPLENEDTFLSSLSNFAARLPASAPKAPAPVRAQAARPAPADSNPF